MREKLELLLVMSQESLSLKEVAKALKVEREELEKTIDELNEIFASQNRGYEIIRFRDKIQLATTSLYQDFIDEFFSTTRKKGLSDSALEVLAALAYKGAMTKAQLSDLRGVSCDYAVNTLVSRNLIEVVGTLDAVGNPYLYNLTDTFFKVFDIQDVSEL